MKDYGEDPPYPENPPWTMFFDGPLYERYREFMANKDFSKILLTSKLKMANQDSSIADLPDVHGGIDWWSIDHSTIGRSEKQMANDTYNTVSDDFYKKFTRGKKGEKHRTRRTRAIILIIILVLLGVSLGTALIIHYFFIPPDQDLTPAQVNISFSGNTSIFDMTTASIVQIESTEIDAPTEGEVFDNGKQDGNEPDADHTHVEEDILNPDGRLFDENVVVTVATTIESTLSTKMSTKIGTPTSKTSTPMKTTTLEMLTTETETFNPLDFFAIDEDGVTSTDAGLTTPTMKSSKETEPDTPTSAIDVTTFNDSLTTLNETNEFMTTGMQQEITTMGQVEAANVSTDISIQTTPTQTSTKESSTQSLITTMDNIRSTTEGPEAFTTLASTSTAAVAASSTSANNTDNAVTTQITTTTAEFVTDNTTAMSDSGFLETTTSDHNITSAATSAVADIFSTIPAQSTTEPITTGLNTAPDSLPQSTIELQTTTTQEESTMQTTPLVTSITTGSTQVTPTIEITSIVPQASNTSTESAVTRGQNTTDFGPDGYTTGGGVTEMFTTTTMPETTTEVIPQMWMDGSTAYKSETAHIICKVLNPGRVFIITIKEVKAWFPIEVSFDSNRTVKWMTPGSSRHNFEFNEVNSSSGFLEELTLTFRISKVECQDSGMFECVITKGQPVVTKTASVIIVGRPDSKIELQIGPSIVEDRALRLTAIWQAGYPIPWTNMSWTALDSDNNTYNLAEYGEYRDYESHVDHDECSTFLKSSIVIFPKVHLNDTAVIVKPDLVTTRGFVNETMKEYLNTVQYGIQRILVIPLNYCQLSKGVKDLSIIHPFTACTKYIRCLPGDLVVQQCPTGTCFSEIRQECT